MYLRVPLCAMHCDICAMFIGNWAVLHTIWSYYMILSQTVSAIFKWYKLYHKYTEMIGIILKLKTCIKIQMECEAFTNNKVYDQYISQFNY